jgi:IS5 family transposase
MKTSKNPCAWKTKMYRQKEDHPEFVNFYLPFGGHLDANNRRVRLAAIVPWKRVEETYASHFASNGMGAPAHSSRLALGALIIKERLDITDEETLEQIKENPYLQYFTGMEGYRTEPPFDVSMMEHFRKRFGKDVLITINERIHEETVKKRKDDDPDGESGKGEENAGKLIIDALYEPHKGEMKKPRTYRKIARKAYLSFCRKERPRERDVMRAKREQPGFIRRNFRSIKELNEATSLSTLSKEKRRNLMVAHEIHRQQLTMLPGTKTFDCRPDREYEPAARTADRARENVGGCRIRCEGKCEPH